VELTGEVVPSINISSRRCRELFLASAARLALALSAFIDGIKVFFNLFYFPSAIYWHALCGGRFAFGLFPWLFVLAMARCEPSDMIDVATILQHNFRLANT